MAVHELFAYICVRSAADAIEFYARAFDAHEKFRLTEPSGRVGHAEVDFGGVTLMLADEFPEMGFTAPSPGQPTSLTLHLHVDDADAVMQRALDAGATLDRPIQDQFYGERSGSVRDPFGHRWLIGHHIEDVSTAEMQRRYNQAMSGAGASTG